MKNFTKSFLLSLCVLLVLLSAAARPTVIPAVVQPASAESSYFCLPPLIPCGLLPALPNIRSRRLVHVNIPLREGQAQNTLPLAWRLLKPVGFKFQPAAGAVQQTCSSTDIELKILIIATSPTDTNTALPRVNQTLDYQGTPYTVFTASPRPSDPAADRLASLLSNGCHGNFEGVILGNGEVAYSDPSAGWESALTNTEWQSLYTYERTFSVRQATWYTFPSSQYGFNPPSSSGDTTSAPITASYTGAAAPVFGLYANTANPLTIRNVWAYRATPLDGSTSALLSDGSGNALVAIKTYTDGTQNLAMTFDGNPNVIHTEVLAYGVVNWVANGLFLGERHIFITPQEDDIFIDDHVWTEGTACGTDPETTPGIYRITGNDLQAFINWQTSTQSRSTTQNFVLTHAFVGEGTNGEYNPDTLTSKAQTTQSVFNWVNHTYNHMNLDNTSYNTTMSQLTQNNKVAQQMGFTNINGKNLITPDISGLSNPNALQAMYDAGIRYVVSDTSRAGMNNPSPNIGIYNQYQPAILEIPRYPDNLFYNVSNPEQWIEEYNCFYASYWGRNLTYPEVLDKESDVLVHYVLQGNMDPWMFHQPNLRAYDGTHTLLGDLMDAVFSKYNALLTLSINSPKMDDLGAQMANRMAYSSAGVTASIVPGQSITIHSQQNPIVPVTSLPTSDAESYGGQSIAHVSLTAGQSVTISLGGQPGPTPTPGPTSTNTSDPPNSPTSTPGPTNTPAPTLTNTPIPNTPTPTVGPTNTPTPTNTVAPNNLPVANNDSYSMHLSNVILTVPAPGVLGNDTDADGDHLTAVVVTNPTNGALTLNADGSFTYVPTTSLLTFSDSFTYKAFDGKGYSNVATVTIQVIVP